MGDGPIFRSGPSFTRVRYNVRHPRAASCIVPTGSHAMFSVEIWELKTAASVHSNRVNLQI